jgi:2-hydroxy-3-keto-5-methylthiopentenyl-1-phosphate phosphatase
MKTLVQCDFDGTITEEDVSFQLLDAFANGDWRQLLTEYREDKISVGYFNTKAFTMIRADRQTLLNFVKNEVRIRAGFRELLDCCRGKGFRFVIVSNGLDFYIEAILRDIGIDNIEVLAAQTHFSPKGIEVKYIGPEGNQIQDGFKEVYIRLFLSRGYRIVYVGNGASDIPSAKLAHHIFSRGELLTYCKQTNLYCTPFVDLNDVVSGLELLP